MCSISLTCSENIKALTQKDTIYLEQIYTCMRFTEWPVSHSMEDNSNWVLEVEEALLDEAPPERIRILLAGEFFTGYFVFDIYLEYLFLFWDVQVDLFPCPFVLMSGRTALRSPRGNPASRSSTMSTTIRNNQPSIRPRQTWWQVLISNCKQRQSQS